MFLCQFFCGGDGGVFCLLKKFYIQPQPPWMVSCSVPVSCLSVYFMLLPEFFRALCKISCYCANQHNNKLYVVRACSKMCHLIARADFTSKKHHVHVTRNAPVFRALQGKVTLQKQFATSILLFYL